MTIESRVIGSYTEIYVNGGGYFTQSSPTHFHNFYTRKMLTASESIEDFREVTAAERSKIEAEDAAFVRPPQLFIDQWNKACGTFGCYNERTGYFELNGLTDIDYAEAMEIFDRRIVRIQDYTHGLRDSAKARTNICQFHGTFYTAVDIACLIAASPNVEVVRLSADKNNDSCISVNNCNEAFSGSRKLKTIYPIICDRTTGYFYDWHNAFNNCSALENVKITGLKYSMSFGSSPLLSFESLQYTIANATPQVENVAITLHPDVFAKIEDESNEQWHSLLALAQEKGITLKV